MLLVDLAAAIEPADAIDRSVVRTRARMEGCVVLPPDNGLRMVVECGEEGTFSVPLEGLVEACRGRAAACSRYRRQLVDALVATRKARDLTLDAVVPVVRDEAWVARADALLAAGGGTGRVVTTTLSAPLVVVWMRDSPEAFRPLTNLNLVELQVDVPAVEAAARRNCASVFKAPPMPERTPVLVGEYGACLIFAPPPARWLVWATPNTVVLDSTDTADAALAAARAATPTLPLVAIERR